MNNKVFVQKKVVTWTRGLEIIFIRQRKKGYVFMEVLR